MPRRIKLEFPGTDRLTVAGLLETPDFNPHSFALFAHCFTCGKDVVSASRIARALVARGYAVLRFDFTGLGGDAEIRRVGIAENTREI
jgi:alpha/beta superfamily hydrolase